MFRYYPFKVHEEMEERFIIGPEIIRTEMNLEKCHLETNLNEFERTCL